MAFDQVAALLLVSALLMPAPAAAQDDELKRLDAEAAKYRGAFDWAREAETLRKGVALIEAKEGRDAPALVPWLIRLGNSLRAPRDLPEAQAALERAIRIVEKTKGPEDRAILDAVTILAFVYAWQGKPADAQALYRRAIAIAEKAYGPDSDRVYSYSVGLGHSYRSARKFAEAEAAYQRALAIVRTHKPPRFDPWMNKWLALNRADQGRYAEAEPLVLEAIEHWQTDKFRGDASERRGPLQELWSLKCRVERGLGRLEAAASSCEESLRLAESGQPEFLYTALSDAGEVYQQVKRYGDAEKQYRRALALAERLAGPDGFDAARMQTGLGRALAGQRRWPEAEALFQHSFKIRERLYGANDADLQPFLEDLARLYRDSGRDAEARRIDARIRALKPAKR
jgi:tetratricopeptide (TPR) repeat protein